MVTEGKFVYVSIDTKGKPIKIKNLTKHIFPNICSPIPGVIFYN